MTRYHLRLSDPSDSRLGGLREGYRLSAARWTGRAALFVGFYTPPATGALEDLQRRLADAWTWGTERLANQPAETCSVLLVALGPAPGVLPQPPPATGPLRVGALSVDGATGAVTPLTALPPGLPGIRDLRRALAAVLAGQPVPTLAAVDLAERQVVAGGYAAPARRRLANVTPVVSYGLIAIWIAVWLLEISTKKAVGLDAAGRTVYDYPVADALLVVAGAGQHTDWWRLVTAGFTHSPTDPAHILFNGLAMFWIGASVERLYGRLVLLGTFLASVVGADLFFVAMTDIGFHTGGSALGASTGLAGLVGLLLVLGRVQGRDVPVGLVSSLRQYALLVIAINIVFGLASSNVSNTGHLGGLLSGVLVGLVLPPLRSIGGRDLTSRERAAIAAIVVFCAVALATGLIEAARAIGS
ncbi:MAG TPA: rhomboid family intramembrane serine protease [Candidatus Dormibacteraeota bacterium]|nr:rhomboid family intramembrane serine protease [Candidatus Dormibacteraeota bacterium]